MSTPQDAQDTRMLSPGGHGTVSAGLLVRMGRECHGRGLHRAGFHGPWAGARHVSSSVEHELLDQEA